MAEITLILLLWPCQGSRWLNADRIVETYTAVPLISLLRLDPLGTVSKIGVIGLGSVGWALVHSLSRFYDYVGYDARGDYDWNEVIGADVLFVSVPTPEGPDGRLDCKTVREVLRRLSQVGFAGPVGVKSTVRVGFMEEATSEFPLLRLVYMPEFLRERSRFTWSLDPDRLVLGGRPRDVEEILRYFFWASKATVIRTDYRSAEVGKLAHNAFIATKVSFTNEIEAVSRRSGADAKTVMSVVASDRRVRCADHLRPGLGPYRGKCVPKDTDELVAVGGSKARLLSVVADMKGPPDEGAPSRSDPPVAVIVPTKDRAEKLRRALVSIADQTRQPEHVIVVSDSSGREAQLTHSVVSSFSGILPVREIPNTRTHNVSGALNSGLAEINRTEQGDRTFLALLDDDDWWDRRYLENVTSFASELKAEWVITGLIRHEAGRRGCLQRIPSTLSVQDFLVTNPGVQGSNLFLCLSRMIEVGGFDEDLSSTTDRDLCIRLLRLPGMRYEVLRNHLVHHDAAEDSSRLSYPGSPQKRAGLESFYRKYAAEMSPEQDAEFRERARRLFSIELLAH